MTLRWMKYLRHALPLLAFLAVTPAGAQDEKKPEQAEPPPARKRDKKRKKKQEPPGDEFRTPGYWRAYHPDLAYHPIGPVLERDKFRLTSYIPMQPSGFPADDFNHWLAPTFGIGAGWEITSGVTGAQRLGPGGEALFYGGGVQKQFITETRGRPAVSFGGYAITGPHHDYSDTAYLAGSKLVLGGRDRGYGVVLHGGVKFQTFGGNDYGSGSGVRPYVGASLGLRRRFFISTEFSPSQPWEREDLFSVEGTYLIYKSVGISGGIRSSGYRTLPFVGIVF
jgi:hypothetical protein